jgi:hypothetical protein
MFDNKDMKQALESGDEAEIAGAQVGVGSGPGRPPARGTGARDHADTSPPTGRLDAERSTWGESGQVAGRSASGQPVDNVGSTEGDMPGQAAAEFPTDDPLEQPGVLDAERTARTP